MGTRPDARRRLGALALALALGAAAARAQEPSLDLRRHVRRPSPSRVLRLLALEEERSTDPPPVPRLEAVADASAEGAPHVGLGPLRLPSQSPLQALRGGIGLDVPAPLPAGGWELRESLTWSRLWARSDAYLLSFETLEHGCSVAHALSDRLRIEAAATSTTRFAGRLDGFVRDFHDAAGIDQGGRDLVPEGEYIFRLGDVEIPEGAGTDHASVGLRWEAVEGTAGGPAVAACLALTKGIGAGGRDVEAAAGLTLARRWGEIHGYLGLGAAWQGGREIYGLELRPFGASVLAAVEWAFAGGASLVLQHLWTRGPLGGYGDLSKPSFELGLGLKLRLGGGSVLELGLTENVLVFDSGPDFGVHAGLALRF